jgi:hypothetical protein
MMHARTLAPAVLSAVAVLAAPSGAGAATVPTQDVTIKGYTAPGSPSQYNRVSYRRYGPASAKKVLVLVPGTLAGAGTFDVVAPQIVKRVPGVEVWAQDRRENLLEDTALLERVRAGRATPKQALDYYLGWIADPSIQPRYRPRTNAETAFAKTWGLRVAMEDLRRIVLRARDGGRRTVILGGHSLGGGEAAIYATWDFDGRPGYRDIAGIVAIDGGWSGSGDRVTPEQARAQLAELDTKGPWTDLLGLGLPWTAGAFGEVAAAAALRAPTEPSILQGFALLPETFKSPVPLTNRAALGYAFDRKTSPSSLALIHIRSGAIAPDGPLRDWRDDGITPIENLATAFTSPRLTAQAWYFPTRLSIDARAARSQPSPGVSRILGLRVRHLRGVDVPYYAFQAELAGRGDGLKRGARDFQRRSRIPRVTVVDRRTTYSHLDPLLAAEGRNEFVRTVAPWLRAIR